MAEFSFNCPFCNLELSIDESGIGQEIECPGCKEVLIIPAPGGGGGAAAEEEERGPAIPQGSFPEAKIIKNASKSLDIAAKTVKKLRVKTFRHHEHVKDGKDAFDDVVSNFIGQHPEDDIVSITGIQYTHQLKQKDAEGKETSVPTTEYGVLVHYKA
ncbi:MAG: Uncharacterized protein FD161_2016 [Limisphaerales bacterium]|nr:MAG: Uncharacterized protein FD161_2016 [Limisphaerales bacterium]KAG0509056.1 MAG: Uncharacterized protein E1N63_1818 [Limisphaerales bacterium]TXT47711.1 MAG: Uncharacterized protein FD140_4077 [Limisphaerales bacterium]